MGIYQQIIDCILASKSIVITAHQSPDGDSIGSSLGLYRFIQKLGKEVVVCHPDHAPASYNWLIDTGDIFVFDRNPTQVTQLILDADLLFCLDYNNFSRVGQAMQEVVERFDKTVILIDHHLHPTIAGDLCLSDPSSCSTAQLVYQVIRNSNKHELLDASVAEPLYMGIVTDTGSFRYDSVQAETHRIVAEILELGVKHHKIHENIFDNNSLNQLRLWGYAITTKLTLVHQNTVAVIGLSRLDLSRFQYQKGDTEGLVNWALSIAGVKMAVLLSEQDKKIRLSFRSVDDWPVNIIAKEQFNGGGHQFAAGGTSTQSLQETIAKLERQIPHYFPLP